MLCECNKEATFKIHGKRKADKDHTLCRQCHKSLSDSQYPFKEKSVTLDWNKLDILFPTLLKSNFVTLNPPYATEENKVCEIKIGEQSATASILDEDNIYDLPSLLYSFNDTAANFIQHWLWQILDLPEIQKVNSVKIQALGNWFK